MDIITVCIDAHGNVGFVYRTKRGMAMTVYKFGQFRGVQRLFELLNFIPVGKGYRWRGHGSI